MTGRIIQWPTDLRMVSVTPIDGPDVVSSGVNTALNGAEQVVRSIGNLIAIDITFPPAKGSEARAQRGLFTSLRSGVNAVRFQYPDPDRRTLREAGVNADGGTINISGIAGLAGANIVLDLPTVDVNRTANRGTNQIRLANEFWGRDLQVGEWISFYPNHPGVYQITDVLPNGFYRIWPNLRQRITVADYASFNLMLIMKTFPGGAQWGRGPDFSQGGSLSLVEVPAYALSNFVEGV